MDRSWLNFIRFFVWWWEVCRQRDFQFLRSQSEMMMELHDNFLNTYSHYFSLEEFFQQMRATMTAKTERFKVLSWFLLVISPLLSQFWFFLSTKYWLSFKVNDSLRSEKMSCRTLGINRKKMSSEIDTMNLSTCYGTPQEHLCQLYKVRFCFSAENLAVVNAVSLTAGAEQEEILYSVINILDAYKKTMPIIKVSLSTSFIGLSIGLIWP